MSAAGLMARKEAGELLLDLRRQAWLLAMACALSAFSLLLVGSAELSLLDNAQVVYDMASIATALGALLALVVSVDGIGGERERGSLVPLLLTPPSRGGILLGKIGGVAMAWAAMLVLAVPFLWAVGSTGQNCGTAWRCCCCWARRWSWASVCSAWGLVRCWARPVRRR